MKTKGIACLILGFSLVSSVAFSNMKVYATSLGGNEQKIVVNNSDGTHATNTDATTYHLQHSDFNPLKATNQDLKANGYPARPTDKNQLKTWEKAVSVKLITPNIVNTKRVNYGDNLIKSNNILNVTKNVGNTNMTYSYNWSGYEKLDTEYGASGVWTVPDVSATAILDRPAHSSQWAGFGGSAGTTTLVQAGSAAQSGILGSSDYLWFEIFNSSYNQGYEAKITNLPCSVGDQINTYVQTVSYSGKNATFNFYVANLTTNQGGSIQVSITDNNNAASSAEWISEDVGGTPYPQTVTNGSKVVSFNNCFYQSSIAGEFNPINSSTSNLYGVTMLGTNKSTILASPSSLNSNTSGFNINWNNYK